MYDSTKENLQTEYNSPTFRVKNMHNQHTKHDWAAKKLAIILNIEKNPSAKHFMNLFIIKFDNEMFASFFLCC